MTELRDALVHIVCVLGAPSEEAYAHGDCEGCAYERHDAIVTALVALDYMRELHEVVVEGPPPVVKISYDREPMDAYRQFLREGGRRLDS